MSQHYTKNTKAVSKWCPTCGRNTMHRVDFKRIGSCTEHAASGMSKRQEAAQKAREEAEAQPCLLL